MQGTVKTKQNDQAPSAKSLGRLYEADETAWLVQMSQLIMQRQYENLDFKNLKEYLLDMAKRDKREVVSRLTTLLTHVLKWDHQSRKRSRSWATTIMAQRDELQDILESKTLAIHALEMLPKTFARARNYAVKETGIGESKFPSECPYSLKELLTIERSTKD